MCRWRVVSSGLVVSVTIMTACGGGGTGPTGGGSGSMSATINGTAWSAQSNLIQFPAPQKQGHYPLYGARTAGNTLNGVTFNLVGITGPGTYRLGTAGGVSGGFASVNEGSAIWQTPLSGAAGTISISTLTDSRIAGTFQFTAEGVVGSSGTREVTNGQFDIPITLPGNLPPMAHADTGFMAVTMGGNPWYGATVAGGAPTGGSLLVISVNTTNSLTVSIAPYNGPGTYTVGGTNVGNRITVTQGTVQGLPCCWGGRTQFVDNQLVSLDNGTITITSATANRIRGTFSATLAPGLTGTATANLVLTNGGFSYGFP